MFITVILTIIFITITGDLYAPPTPPGPARPNPINAGAPIPAVPPPTEAAGGGGGGGGPNVAAVAGDGAVPINGPVPEPQPAVRQDIPADQGQGQGNVVGPPQTFVQRLAQQILEISHSGTMDPHPSPPTHTPPLIFFSNHISYLLHLISHLPYPSLPLFYLVFQVQPFRWVERVDWRLM